MMIKMRLIFLIDTRLTWVLMLLLIICFAKKRKRRTETKSIPTAEYLEKAKFSGLNKL